MPIHLDTVIISMAGLFVPFLGVVGLLDERVYRAALYFWIALVAIFFVMLLVAGAGVTPERGERPFGPPGNGPLVPHEVVTNDEVNAWFNEPWVREDVLIGAGGLAFATPFLFLTWAYRNRALSRPLRILTHVLEVGGLVAGFWGFLASVLIPYLRQHGA